MSHGHAAGAGILLLLGIGGLSYLALGESAHPYRLPELGVQVAPAGASGCQNLDDELRLLAFPHEGILLGPALDFFKFRLGAGVCGIFSAGAKVVVEGKAHHPDPALDKRLHGLICVRSFGEKHCNWTATSFVFPDLQDAVAD